MITILLNDELQQEIGFEFLEIEQDKMTVGELKDELENVHLLSPLNNYFVAINEQLALHHEIVKSGDIVTLVPATSS